jgi:hypothetical protein
MRWWTSGLLAFLVASASAHGQDVLSDTELFASYCLGHFNRVMQETQDIQRSTGPCVEVKGAKVSCRELDDLWRQGFEEIRAKQLRLRRYLIARGIFTIRSDVPVLAGLAAATNQGVADTEGCFRHALEDCRGAADPSGCIEQGSKQWPQCVQTNRCNDLSRLPF